MAGQDGLTPIITSERIGSTTVIYLAYSDAPENTVVLATIADGAQGIPGADGQPGETGAKGDKGDPGVCDCADFVGGRCDLTYAIVSGLGGYQENRTRLFDVLDQLIAAGGLTLAELQAECWTQFNWAAADRIKFNDLIQYVYAIPSLASGINTWWETIDDDLLREMYAVLGDDSYLEDGEWQMFLSELNVKAASNNYWSVAYLYHAMFPIMEIRGYLAQWTYMYGGKPCDGLVDDGIWCYEWTGAALGDWLENFGGEGAFDGTVWNSTVYNSTFHAVFIKMPVPVGTVVTSMGIQYDAADAPPLTGMLAIRSNNGTGSRVYTFYNGSLTRGQNQSVTANGQYTTLAAQAAIVELTQTGTAGFRIEKIVMRGTGENPFGVDNCT